MQGCCCCAAGIKVDKGVVNLPGTDGETTTQASISKSLRMLTLVPVLVPSAGLLVGPGRPGQAVRQVLRARRALCQVACGAEDRPARALNSGEKTHRCFPLCMHVNAM